MFYATKLTNAINTTSTETVPMRLREKVRPAIYWRRCWPHRVCHQ